MEINQPDVMAEVTAAFDRYEAALVGNDVAVLDELFWRSPNTLRYGTGENLYGYDEIAAFRAARPAAGPREILRRQITTYGRDAACAHIEFHRAGSAVTGRQTQTWIRLPEGWRVVSAHVSVMA